ncbi:hypothetical protein PR048_015431 [Dryococelus australis]|uniref:Uncharacterized protein n=1 Tax=Dryococelus australis TaxID=614101 RepID=A0ABQ9HGX2_9NEOP|nr:hypothetical protein PR048_015431 [Dryococelus australis]
MLPKNRNTSTYKAIYINDIGSHIILGNVNPDLVANIRKLPGSVETEDITSSFSQLQIALNPQASENNSVDIVKALNVMKLSRPSFATKALEAIWSPCANVDCERFLSSYNTVITDRRTILKESSLAVMAIFDFEDLC